MATVPSERSSAKASAELCSYACRTCAVKVAPEEGRRQLLRGARPSRITPDLGVMAGWAGDGNSPMVFQDCVIF